MDGLVRLSLPHTPTNKRAALVSGIPHRVRQYSIVVGYVSLKHQHFLVGSVGVFELESKHKLLCLLERITRKYPCTLYLANEFP